jgi:excinuclease ABC subunit A
VILDRDKVVPDASRTLAGGAVTTFETKTGALFRRKMVAEAKEHGIPLDVPFRELTQTQKDWVFTGGKPRAGYRGVEGLFRKLERKRYRPHVRIFLARYRGYETCPSCRGSRLHPVALSVTLGGLDLAALENMPVRELTSFLRSLELGGDRMDRVGSVLGEIRERLGYLLDVGLGYLTLARTARTLSGGETQRIRLA